jgi:hypothetical protein
LSQTNSRCLVVVEHVRPRLEQRLVAFDGAEILGAPLTTWFNSFRYSACSESTPVIEAAPCNHQPRAGHGIFTSVRV